MTWTISTYRFSSPHFRLQLDLRREGKFAFTFSTVAASTCTQDLDSKMLIICHGCLQKYFHERRGPVSLSRWEKLVSGGQSQRSDWEYFGCVEGTPPRGSKYYIDNSLPAVISLTVQSSLREIPRPLLTISWWGRRTGHTPCILGVV